MKYLIVRRQGQHITELKLEDDAEYFAGRSVDCDIHLDENRGISRRHLRIYQESGIWVVELLSKVGEMTLESQSVKVLQLEKPCIFTVAPFEFEYKIKDEKAERPETSRELTVRTQATSALDTTMAAGATLIPYLRISRSGGHDEILKLEGQIWVAGRESTCEISLEDDHASRRHFEIVHTHEGYFVTDLGSANGTLLNEETLPPNQPFQLASGDVIRIADTKIQFEIHDPHFQMRLNQALPAPFMGGHLPEPAAPAWPSGPVSPGLPAPYRPHHGPAVVKVTPRPDWRNINLQTLKNIDYGKHKVRIGLALLVPVIIFGLLQDDTPAPAPTQATDHSSSSVTFETLSPQQKQAVKDSFNLAKNLYVQGKYELCLTEMNKLHKMVPAYDNSKEIESYCVHGAELVLREREKERREQERAEVERVIQTIVDDCRSQMKANSSVADVRICLAPAIERDPEHPLIRELEQMILVREEQERQKAEAAQNYQRRRETGRRLLRQAQADYKKGNLLGALNNYEKFIDGNYPAAGDDKAEAERNLATVRKQLSVKVNDLLQNCKESMEKMQFREAHDICSKVLRQDPGNAEAAKMKEQALKDLNRENKSMYEDSVLEESMGNVDTAKEKWRQIMKKAIPGDEYYNKAKRSLQKYGG